jgi:CIC family chloride channel protein
VESPLEADQPSGPGRSADGAQHPAEPTTPAAQQDEGGLVALALVALVAGVVAGLVGATFRLLLVWADRGRDALIAWAHGQQAVGFLVLAGITVTATAIAAWLVRRFSPQAIGSGIPHVESVLHGHLPAAGIGLVPVKFSGGLLAIGSGLALGREGPTVQMGASLAHLVGKIFRRTETDCRVLLAAGAGAGLATAFNAPIAGAVFVLEELARKFDTRITIATLGASAGAIGVARLVLGSAPDFRVGSLPPPGFGTVPIQVVLGVAFGLLGVAYNYAILGALDVAERFGQVATEWRAALVGVAVAILGWFGPILVGGGDPLTQETLLGSVGLVLLPVVFLLRFSLGPLSYAAGTPGGLFAPMLVLGAQAGFLLGSVSTHLFPGTAVSPVECAVIGMSAFFAAVVRAPVTGVILVIELTGSSTPLLPMLAACFAAMLVPTILRNPPIYDSLRSATSPPNGASIFALRKTPG